MMRSLSRYLLIGAVVVAGIHASVVACTSAPPVASIENTDPLFLHTQRLACFNGEPSRDDEGIEWYKWYWGDGATSGWKYGHPCDCGPECDSDHWIQYMWSNVGIYTVRLVVEDSDDQQDEDTIQVCTATMGYSIADWYVPVNDDDDDENGRMDNKNNVGFSGDDDLVSVSLSVTPPDCYNVVTLNLTQGQGALQVRAQATQPDLIINTTTDFSEEWDVGGDPFATTVYMEGVTASAGLQMYDPSLEWDFHGWGIFPLGGWNGTDPSKRWITVVHVDMDLGVGTPEEVKDNDYTWPGITEETTPGGFIARGGFVPLTIRRVSPPEVEGEDPQTWPELTLSVEGASSKIQIWNTGKTALANLNEPLTPPSGGTILWVKGVQASSSSRDITLVLTHGSTGFKDRIKLTVYDADLDIYNGQGGPLAPETDQDADGIEDEEDIGAFTVANLNDTNGDGFADNDDNHRPVTANGSRGRNEIDLMKLVLHKPKPDGLTGDVRLVIVSGNIEIWSDSVKTTQITNLTFPTTNFTSDTIEWYVEARSSTTLQGIKLRYEFKRAGTTEWIPCDTVTATGIWASCSKVCSANKTAAEVDTYMGQDYVNNGGNVRSSIYSETLGTGVQPLGWSWGNVILLEFTVWPNNISSVPANYGNSSRARPYFDITRVREGPAIYWTSGSVSCSPCTHLPETVAADADATNDLDLEYVNDDNYGDDETSEPSASGHMWVVDTPGFSMWYNLLGVFRVNFNEFLRMGTTADPTGNLTAVGSRCSQKQSWHTKTTISSIGPCAGANEIGVNHFTFAPEALHTYALNPTLASYSTVVMRGLAVAATAGGATETVDLYLQDEDGLLGDDTLARYDGQHIGTNYDIHEPGAVGSKPQMKGKEASMIVGDQTAYIGETLIGTDLSGNIWGYGGGSGFEGQSGDPAEIFHEIAAPGSNPESPAKDCYGVHVSMGAPTAPNPLVFGDNNVTCPSVFYVEAVAHGGGTQSERVDLYEDDVVQELDHLLSMVDAVGTRPANAIRYTAIPLTAVGGGPVTFVLTNTDGTISGNVGSAWPHDPLVQLYYRWAVFVSSQIEVSVQQP
jgi:hypothetical protein